MAIVISRMVRKKLANKQPPVTEDEIRQCFATRSRKYLLDTREDHKSDPPTKWFISETYYGRRLKIAFIETDEDVIIRTAYPPNAVESAIYASNSG